MTYIIGMYYVGKSLGHKYKLLFYRTNSVTNCIWIEQSNRRIINIDGLDSDYSVTKEIVCKPDYKSEPNCATIKIGEI